MPVYKYTARDPEGNNVKSTIKARSKDQATAELYQQGLTPLTIESASGGFDWSNILKAEIIPKKVTNLELSMFCRQMYTLIHAGVPILDSLSKLSQVVRNPTFQRALVDVGEQISAGTDLSKAFAAYPKIFNTLFVNIVAVGEHSGQLEAAFWQLTKHLELENQTSKRIKTAMRYPKMVIGAIIVAICVMNFMVIPAFADMFKGFGAELPLATRFLMASSQFMLDYWYLILGVIIIIVTALKFYMRTEGGMLLWHRLKLKLPIFGSIIRRSLLARFCRILLMMIKAGVPLGKSIELVANAIGNEFVRQNLLAMKAGVEQGMGLGELAGDTKLFSPIAIQMLSVGEESGSIDTMLAEIADFYEREVDYDLSRLSTLMEPIILTIMGAMVLILALGIFLPMWDMASVATGR